MFCSQCGQQATPAHANYCWNCGNALKAAPNRWAIDPGPTISSPPSWEKCEIVRTYTPDRIVPSLKAEVTFVAQADGPTGRYNAAKSPVFTINPSFSDPDCTPKRDDRDANAALEALAATLLQQGWTLIGEGDHWFSRQFRRATP